MPFYFTVRYLRILTLCTKDFLLLVFQATPCFCYSNNQSFTEELQLKDEELMLFQFLLFHQIFFLKLSHLFFTGNK